MLLGLQILSLGSGSQFPGAEPPFAFSQAPIRSSLCRRAHIWVICWPQSTHSDHTSTSAPSPSQHIHPPVADPHLGQLLFPETSVESLSGLRRSNLPIPQLRTSTGAIFRTSSALSTCPSATEPPRDTDCSPLQSQIVHAPGQRRPGPGFRGHYLRAELRPRPLRHRGDPDQRSRQRPRPPEPHGAPGLAPSSQRLPAPAQPPPFRGAVGPRAGALVPR